MSAWGWRQDIMAVAVLAGLLWAAMAWTGVALAQPYTFRTIELPVPVAEGASCSGLNNDGDLVGVYVDGHGRDQGFLLTSNGQFMLLPLLNPHGLTALRHFTGWYADARTFGFLHTGLEFVSLSIPIGSRTSSLTEATGLNERDTVVGDYRDDTTGSFHAFLYQDGHYATIDPPFWVQTPFGCGAEGINADGAIVGNCSPFTYVQFQGQFYPWMIPGSDYTFAHAINRWWGVAGTYCDTACHGFVYGPTGFRPIDVPGATLTEVWSVNDAWQICGRYLDAQGVSHIVIGDLR